MNSVSEALNTLISAVNIAHGKGGVYSLEEAHYIHLAISYLNSLQQQAPDAQQVPQPQQPVQNQEPQVGDSDESDGDY